MSGRRRGTAALGGVALLVTLSGCGLGNGLYDAPLPGGADVGDHPYTVTVQLADARDLVPQAGVRVNDVPVGRVSSIDLDRTGKIAEVGVELNGSVRLPANAIASVQQTSLLGEKYIALAAPLTAAATGRLRDGDTVPVARTTNGVEIEQVFGALSLLLNGGGIGQLNDISRELNAFAGGHEQQIRTFFGSVQRVVGQLEQRSSSITRALDALATLSDSLRSQDARIRTVLRSLAPGIDVLAAQRRQLTTALTALNRLSRVTTATLDASKDDIIADLKALAPILRHLADAGAALPKSLQVLVTYPFSDGALAGIKGDYLNGYATVSLRTPGGSVYRPAAATRLPGSGPAQVATPAGLLPATSSAASGLPATLTLTPERTTPGSAATSRSGSSARRSTGTSSRSGSGGSSGSGSGSGSASGSKSGSGSASGSGSGSASGSTSAGTTSDAADGGGD
ncbi:phospholipid/cholesterol/gamma-HCH transport system substrate-binding protein [Jatrophihabitans endophyticus]|uniref:Phospholipid/cholesterol/gamma-HCH transport system substrate-binding protein n=1 Tax=Jatrophihabitans endophyticus TaxID=1206085 RepID=A0A1M5ETA5_9ACTN|nr:MCE family protein [Jatrophihabitans endophyticus]SHF82410.1 phospholipid/cholesterol/gamma-HCH transport system substrate-binding protein [Jatrophihabitans endophyticus]